MIEIIIFAIITFFVVKKLYSMLGEESDDRFFGYEHRTENKNNIKDAEKIEEASEDNDLLNKLSSRSQEHVKELKTIIDGFSITKFQQIATKVLEMIIKANNDRDKEVVKKLLSSQLAEAVCSSFDDENKSNIVLVEIEKCETIDINKTGKVFEIIILFKTKQINYTTDKDNNIIDGDKSEIVNVNEQWTFIHDITSKNKTWFVNKIEEC